MERKNIIIIVVIVVILLIGLGVGIYFLVRPGRLGRLGKALSPLKEVDPISQDMTNTKSRSHEKFTDATEFDDTVLKEILTKDDIYKLIATYSPKAKCLFDEMYSPDGFSFTIKDADGNNIDKNIKINDNTYTETRSTKDYVPDPLPVDGYFVVGTVITGITYIVMKVALENNDYESFSTALIGLYANNIVARFAEDNGVVITYTRNDNDDIELYIPNIGRFPELQFNLRDMFSKNTENMSEGEQNLFTKINGINPGDYTYYDTVVNCTG